MLDWPAVDRNQVIGAEKDVDGFGLDANRIWIKACSRENDQIIGIIDSQLGAFIKPGSMFDGEWVEAKCIP